MKAYFLPLTLLLMFSCSTEKEIYLKYSDKSLKVSRVEGQNGNLFTIKCQIKKNNEIYSSPLITLFEKKQGVIKVCKEVFIPDYWTHPKLIDKEGMKVYSPSSPVFSKPSEFGLVLKITAAQIETLNNSEWIHIQGEMSCSDLEEKTATEGNYEAVQNYSVSYSTDTAIFSLYVKNGLASSCEFKAGNNKYHFKCKASVIRR